MYVHFYQLIHHAWFSETRLFMTMIMGAAMMIVMLSFMWGMYENSRVNVAILAVAGLMLLLSEWLKLKRKRKPDRCQIFLERRNNRRSL